MFISLPQEEPLYRTRHIRRNIGTSESKNRAESQKHRRIYLSKGHRSNRDEPIQNKSLSTIQTKKVVHQAEITEPIMQNYRNFLNACKLEKEREDKIRSIEAKRRLSIQELDKMEEFVGALIESNSFFRTIEYTLVESIALLSTRVDYDILEKRTLSPDRMGFILFGKLKL